MMNNIISALPTILQYLLGSIFFIYGLDGFFQFMPTKTVAEPASVFIGALINSGYLWALLKATETLGGFLLLTNLYVPLALVILAPLVVNIFLFHLFLNPAEWKVGIYPVGVTIVIAETALAWFYRSHFQSLFVRCAVAQPPSFGTSESQELSDTSMQNLEEN
jgi:putative oxidoreductase